ncbi:precorrin-3B C(17)-methyltransferase [Carboxylicivirga sp. N1Y90]|uniref:precorrin-3B C(17)-methyltransferase n=1 Tax=Carboxylicivirga fragile TaxID=3417571 RepID=UPI003D33F7B9|nr:precorrin-3B C(17)-methyltransferase [Marinilabiliaceae bacterium N1Y90]
MQTKIYSVGIGPGSEEYLTPQASRAIELADVIVGYGPYINYIRRLIAGKPVIHTGMKKERERARRAFQEAEEGKNVAVISSGDSGVYGMAPLLWEMKEEVDSSIEIEVVPGISAMFAAAAKLGAPLGHDFCSISMSDLLTPWERIEKRIHAAAVADFVTAVYNPVSKGRFWQLMRLKEVFLQSRPANTPVGLLRNVGRSDEEMKVLTLDQLEADMVDMFTVVIIGNTQTREFNGHMITPRGYYAKKEESNDKVGRQIMNESFRTILKEIDTDGFSLEHTWVSLHCIHTTADLSIQKVLECSNDVVPNLHKRLYSDKPPAIITDVSMVTRGIRRAIAEKLGLTIKCYLDDERTKALAEKHNITRTQAGIRLAVEEYPNAIYAFGNAPTALIELVKLIRNKTANPAGVIAAPVGFVNVKESKWQLKHGCPKIPSVIVSGRKGGSNVAATIINAILSWNEAQQMHPGEGV